MGNRVRSGEATERPVISSPGPCRETEPRGRKACLAESCERILQHPHRRCRARGLPGAQHPPCGQSCLDPEADPASPWESVIPSPGPQPKGPQGGLAPRGAFLAEKPDGNSPVRGSWKPCKPLLLTGLLEPRPALLGDCARLGSMSREGYYFTNVLSLEGKSLSKQRENFVKN